MITPAFATWYAGLPALASRPATDAVARRTPRPASSMGRRAARNEKNTPVRLTRSTSDHASVGCSAQGARTPAMPAFAHSTSIRPWWPSISDTRRSTEPSSYVHGDGHAARLGGDGRGRVPVPIRNDDPRARTCEGPHAGGADAGAATRDDTHLVLEVHATCLAQSGSSRHVVAPLVGLRPPAKPSVRIEPTPPALPVTRMAVPSPPPRGRSVSSPATVVPCQGARGGTMTQAMISADSHITEHPDTGRFEEWHRGGWDPEARLADQDRDGVSAEVLCPAVGLVLCRPSGRKARRSGSGVMSAFAYHAHPRGADVLETRAIPMFLSRRSATGWSRRSARAERLRRAQPRLQKNRLQRLRARWTNAGHETADVHRTQHDRMGGRS